MRPFEIAAVALGCSVLLACSAQRGLETWVRVASVAAGLALAAHCQLEGLRWHLAPVYAVVLLVAASAALPALREPGLRASVGGLALLAAGSALGTALPVFRMPKPTGPHPVGTTTLHLVDPARAEPRSARPDGRRELMVQLWYPAEFGGPGATCRSWNETSIRTQHLARVSTYAARGVPVASSPQRHPVVLFSPSSGGRRNHNIVLASELASCGFVVAAMDHPFDTDFVAFPDGRKAVGRPDDGAFGSKVEEALATRAADARFVLDELDRRNRRDPDGLLSGRLELTRCAAVGHSLGGAAAAAVASADPRVVAAINFDGGAYGEEAAQGYSKPLLYFCEDLPAPTEAEIAAAVGDEKERLASLAAERRMLRRASARQQGQWIVIRGARHVNYCDSPLYSPIWNWARGGSIRPERALEIADRYTVSFLRRHLMGVEDGLLDAPPPYPEVAIDRPSIAE